MVPIYSATNHCPVERRVGCKSHYVFSSPQRGSPQARVLTDSVASPLVGWHTTSGIVLMSMVPCLMLLTMHQSHLHLLWQLVECKSLTH